MSMEEFQPMKTQTGVKVPSDEPCYRKRILLSYPQLICLCVGAVFVGIGLSIECHSSEKQNTGLRNPAPPSLVAEANTLLHEDSAEDAAQEFKIEEDIIIEMEADKKNAKKDDTPGLKLIWLMSFPNSGTSFTGKVLKEYSKRNTATNYGTGNTNEEKESVPVYPDSPETGPFWVDPHGHTLRDYPHPDNYVLTKTHCGGRCEVCAPERYIENIHSFKYQCLQGKRRYHDEKGKLVDDYTLYDVDMVKKAIHLIRNPYDNVVSRYHLEVNEFKKKNTTNVTKYDGTRSGFREFCHDLDTDFREREKNNRLWDKDLRKIIKDVPCHADFFRYIQWHNLATVLLADLKIPTYVLHYENYDLRFNETLDELMEFIEQEPRGPKVNFIKGKEYLDFFHAKEQAAIKHATMEMALASTWDLIGHYFDDIPDR